MEHDKEQALKNWELSKEYCQDIYDACEEDWNFLHGVKQWGKDDEKTRKEDGRPCLTLNQLAPYAKQITNDIKQARMAIRVVPIDEHADIDTAEVLQGIIRNIEKQSKAQTAYTTAAKNAIGAGIGWIKIETDYDGPTSFDQEIYIRRVLDFSSVYPDPNATAIDGSDMEYCFVRRDYSKDRFKELYPDAEVSSFDEGRDNDTICVVEYYYKYYEKDTIYLIVLPDGIERTINKEQKAVLDEDGTIEYNLVMERETEYPFVKMCVYGGGEDPLEETDIPSQYIPIVPVVGDEVYIDERREFHSLIRQAKDAQRMYNYHKSENVYIVALQPRVPYIAPKGSFKSYPDHWANANSESFAVLEYDIVHDENGQRAEPPRREMPPQGSPIVMQEAELAKEDIRLSMGMPQANMGERGKAVSGIAIRNQQIEGDNATYHFIDNLAASISQVGRICLDMIPRLYSRKKIARIIGDDGQERTVPINQPYVVDENTGQERVPNSNETDYAGVYDIMAGKYDVDMDVGASYSSKRQETADKLIELINAKPELADITGDLLFEALDLPKAREIAERIRSTMPPELFSDDPQAEKLKQAGQAIAQLEDRLKDYEAALQAKNDNAEFDHSVKMKELENEDKKMVIDGQKAAAEIQKTMAEIEKMRAETSGFNIDAVQALGNAVSGMAGQVEDITSAMNIILDAYEDQETPEPEIEGEHKEEDSEE